MLSAILSWSIRNRILVIWASLLLIVAGVVSFLHLPLDAFPDTTPVQVQINSVAPALSPLEIERQITFPVEQAISGLPGLSEVRSLSRFGFSQVTAIFEDEVDVYFARQMVGERLQSAELPAGIERPTLGPIATGLGEIFHYLVTGADATTSELRTAQDWIIEPQLRSVPGVAEVNSWGGEERLIQVLVDPIDLAKHDLTLEQLVSAIEQDNLNVGGGALDRAGQSTLVQGIGIVTAPEEIESIVVATREGVPTYVRDVARVANGTRIRRGAVTADGGGEVVLGLGFMLMGENSHEVARRLRLQLAEVERTLPPGIEVEVVYDRTELVDRVLHTVRTNLFEGALLVVAVLFLFLGNLRAGLIVAAAIPLSMLFAFNFMVQAGIAGTLMSLGAIDFGLIVDSSVIMVENSMRRLAEDRGERSRAEIVRLAALEVRRPTLFGELIIMMVYLPILTLEGVEGKLFRPMAWTVIFALAGSMILSLTLVPALCATVLPRNGSHRGGGFLRGVMRAYRPALRTVLGHPKVVLGCAVALLLAGGFLAARLGSEFVPRLREGSIVINTIRLAGVSLDESVRYGTQIERLLLEDFPDEIDRIWTRTGAAEVATDPMGLELSDVFITLRPRDQWKRARTQDELVERMELSLAGMPGMRVVFTQPIEMRINEKVAGVRTDVGVKLFGDDFEVLAEKAREIEAVITAIPGAADVVQEQLTGQPVLRIEVDREAIGRHGISASTVLGTVAALGPREVGMLQEGERRFPIAVSMEDRYRHDPTAVGGLLIGSASGDRIPLEQLASLEVERGAAAIQREWGKRRVVIQSNVRGRDVGGFVEELKDSLAQVALPPGYFIRLGGQFENLQRAQARLWVVVPIALSLIFALLYLTYRRLTDALRIFAGVPFAALGGVIALTLRDLPFSISAAIGFVALSGVAVLGDMVLVSTVRQLVAEGWEPRAALVEAAERRLRPVLMTGLVASLGFVPMALNTGIGAEVQRPLATVVIGGVISATVLTLFILPVLYSYLNRRTQIAGVSERSIG